MGEVAREWSTSGPVTVRATNARTVRTRANLVNAYRGLVAERGPQVSVSAVADRAGISRSTFYAHYKGLGALADDAEWTAERPAHLVTAPADQWRTQIRTRIRAAVLQVASRVRIEDASLSDVARAAGVARSTVYGYAASPSELLATVLEDEITRLIDSLVVEATTSHKGAWAFYEHAVRAFAVHMLEHEDLYRHGLAAQPPSPTLVALLADQFARLMRYIVVGQTPANPPSNGSGERSTTSTHAMYAAYAGYGGIGILREWLRADHPDPDQLIEVSLTILPPSWFGARGAQPGKTTDH